RSNAHARLGLPILRQGDAALDGALGKVPALLVEEQEIGPGIVADGDVRPAVLVVVRDRYAERFPSRARCADSHRVADIAETAAALIMVERTVRGFVSARRTVAAHAVVPAPVFDFRRPLHVLADKEIEPAVFVVVEPGRAGAPLPPQFGPRIGHALHA